MPDDSPAPGRRAALRERHHRAILDAAAALMRETGATDFSVDELAQRADVARRTVFNHFESLDDIVTTVCGEVLGAVFDRLELLTTPPSAGATMFDELAHALTATDLVTPMAYLTRVLGGDATDALSPRRSAMVGRAFTELSGRLSAELMRRHPEADALDVRLLVGSLMSGTLVLHGAWYAATGAADDAHSRRVWAELVARLIAAARTGYGATTSPSPAPVS